MENFQEKAVNLSRQFAAIYYYCHPSYTLVLSHQAVRALQSVHFKTGSTVSDVATYLACAHNTASEIVHRLVDKGLLIKERREEDERTVVLSLTEQGVEVLYEQTGLDIRRLSECLKGLSEEEQHVVFSGLALLAERLEGQK